MSELQNHFETFAKGPEMDQRSFVKFCKDSGVVCKSFTANDADLVFTKFHTKGSRKMKYKDFLATLPDIAARKKVDEEEVKKQFSSSAGPVLNATVAEPNRFHDDKSLYTGVYAHGGPSVVDNLNLAQMTDRTKESNKRK